MLNVVVAVVVAGGAVVVAPEVVVGVPVVVVVGGVCCGAAIGAPFWPSGLCDTWTTEMPTAATIARPAAAAKTVRRRWCRRTSAGSTE